MAGAVNRLQKKPPDKPILTNRVFCILKFTTTTTLKGLATTIYLQG
jgi:hypothetical protein